MDQVMQKWNDLVAQLAPLIGLKAPSADLSHAIGLYIAVPACLVLAYILLRALLGGFARGGARGKSILLVGPCGSGKTQLLHKLCCNEHVTTVTSMSVAALHVQRNGQAIADQSSSSNSISGAVAVIDYPGHERLRAGLKRQLASSAAVLCVIDTSDLTNQESKSHRTIESSESADAL
eukprot:11645-Heterococcus_DN1.PRE.1